MKEYNKIACKQIAGLIVVVCMVACGLHYAVEAYAAVHPRKVMTTAVERANSEQIGYVCSDADYAIINAMFHEAMSVSGLHGDFEKQYPEEARMFDDMGANYDAQHDCLQCRLKALASCYWDAEWSDCFDDDNGTAADFTHVLQTNKRVRKIFNQYLHDCWGEVAGLDD